MTLKREIISTANAPAAAGSSLTIGRKCRN